jgi:hypothetical protein
MLTWIREKFGPVVVGGIVGFIALIFIFEGAFTRSATRGNHEGALAGTVNGEPITRGEFSRALNQRLEFFKQLSGGKVSEEQIRSFNLRAGVFEELVSRKLMSQTAAAHGWAASDAEIRDRIMEVTVFHKDGKFDPATYRSLLTANNMTPESYEKMVRDDLTLNRMNDFFRKRVKVSEEEVRREFLTTKDKRDIKYVLLTNETARKGVNVSKDDVTKYLADTAKSNLVKNQFEARKERDFKGKKLEDVREQIARDLIAGERTEELRKINEEVAGKVLTQMKSGDAALNSILKPYGVTAKNTGMIPRSSNYIPGIGDSKELIDFAFGAESSQPKKFSVPAGIVVAVVSGTEKPDLAKLSTERDTLLAQLVQRKERAIMDSWMKRAREKAKIEQNKEIVGESG